MNLDPIVHHKCMITQSIKDLHRRPQTVKLREESTGTKVQNVGFDEDFMDMTPKPPSNRNKQTKKKQLSGTTTNKKLLQSKGSNHRREKASTELEEIFTGSSSLTHNGVTP